VNDKQQSMTKSIQNLVGNFKMEDTQCIDCGGVTAIAYRDGADEAAKEALRKEARCLRCEVSRESKRLLAESQAKRGDLWAKVCPKAFMDTDPNYPDLHKPFISAAKEWKYGVKGLGFMGPSRLGKTRSLFLAAKNAFDAGLSVAAIRHTRLTRLVQDAFTGDSRNVPRETLDWLCEADVLILDDIGKPPTTERTDAEFADLLDERIWHQRPVLWSVNGSSKWLMERFGPDRGAPIVKRLTEFSTIVTVSEPTEPASAGQGRRREDPKGRSDTAQLGIDGF
jgi:DNA replication protein DnaC